MSTSNEEIEIRASIEQWEAAMRTGKVDEIVKHYADNLVAYDAVMKLQFVGKKAYTDHWHTFMEFAPHGMIYEDRDLVIHTEGSIAFSYNLARCGGYDDQGNEQFSWMRVTRGYRKMNGQWLVVHEHFSSPFDMESGKVLFDATP